MGTHGAAVLMGVFSAGLLACSSAASHRPWLKGRWAEPSEEAARITKAAGPGRPRIGLAGVRGEACGGYTGEERVAQALRESSGDAYTLVEGNQGALRLRVVLDGEQQQPAPMVYNFTGQATLQLRDADDVILWESTVSAEDSKPAPLGRLGMRGCEQELLPRVVGALRGFVGASVEQARTRAALQPVAPARLRRLAVLEFRGDPQLTTDVLSALSDSARAGALEAVPGRGYQVLTRESMAAVLKDMGRCDATEGDCEVETGRTIGADLLITGEVVRVESSWLVTLKLFEVASGALLATNRVESGAQLELVRGTGPAARALVENAVKDAAGRP